MKSPLNRERFSSLLKAFDELGPIMVLGDIGIDKYTYGDVKRISPEAPVPVLEVRREWLKLGLAANITHNLSTLKMDSLLCGVIGEDLNATRFESLLEDSGLKIWGIVRSKERPTIYKERITTDTQQICRVDYESTQKLDSETEQKLLDRVSEFSENYKALILEDYAKGTLSEKLIQKSMALYKEQGKLVCVDPGVSTPPLYYRGASLLKPNLKESRIMARSLGLESEAVGDVAPFLVEKLGVEKLAITLGPEGMAIIDTSSDGKLKIVPTLATEVYDVSGAGDTAISLLCAALVAGATLEEAAVLANCGSGVVVGKKGTATVDRHELAQYFERFLAKYS
jgi:D-glycero-beta-D-manno-heptose-7-phosphate kinase